MAINEGTSALTVTSEERSWRVNIETAKGSDPVVTVFRERIMTGPDGAIVSRPEAPAASRALSTVADQTVTVLGSSIVLSMAQVAATIAATADLWRQEDIAAAATAD